MTPMQPFQFDQSALVQSTPRIRRELPARVKTVLMLKTLGALLVIGSSLIALMAVNDPQSWRDGFNAEMAHRIALLSMGATALSLLELLGVAGVWTFKRWGVYVLSGFSMLNFVIEMQMHATFSAGLTILSTMIVGFVIASRWEDFE